MNLDRSAGKLSSVSSRGKLKVRTASSSLEHLAENDWQCHGARTGGTGGGFEMGIAVVTQEVPL